MVEADPKILHAELRAKISAYALASCQLILTAGRSKASATDGVGAVHA